MAVFGDERFPESVVAGCSAGEKITVAIKTALGPDILMIPIPPPPPGVAMAAIVELFIEHSSLRSLLE